MIIVSIIMIIITFTPAVMADCKPATHPPSPRTWLSPSARPQHSNLCHKHHKHQNHGNNTIPTTTTNPIHADITDYYDNDGNEKEEGEG
jgi:hypothetical protein